LNIVPHARTEEEVGSFVRAIHAMFSEGSWDGDALLDQAGRYLEFIGPPEADRMSAILGPMVRALRSGEAPSEYINKEISDLSEANRGRLREVPAGLDKAKGYLLAYLDLARVEADAASCEAMCLLQEEVSDALIADVVREWKEAVRSARESNALSPDIFWSSRDHEDEADAVSYYRFLDTFDVGEFPKTVQEIEEMFREVLMMPATWVVAAQTLWLASRSARLLAGVRPFAQRALADVCRVQGAEGWWPRLQQDFRQEDRPSNWTTAYACVAIFRTSRDQTQLEQAREGARWLAQQQEPGGAWRHAPADDDAYARREELHTTLMACEAIEHLDPERYRSTLATAKRWISDQQSPLGFWEGEPPLSPPAMTVQVIEYLEGRLRPSRSLSDYQSIARDFVVRAQESALENNPNAWRLAVVVSFQGLEAFLYACLEHETINVPIFEGTEGNRTIGLRKALRKLEESLQRVGTLAAGQHVQRRNHIDRLIYLRNEVVHKGASVSGNDARMLTDQAARFVEDISAEVFGFSLL